MEKNDLKTTPLTELHLRLGAKMGEFSGYTLPLFYKLGLKNEHLHTRANAGLFDICHMVQMAIGGPQAATLLEYLCPLEAVRLEEGECKYTYFLNENAGIIDDLIVSRQSEDRFIIVANAGCAEKDIAHVNSSAQGFDAEVEVMERGLVALQGPAAEKALGAAGIDASNLVFMRAMDTADGWRISRTGYTGEDGFEISVPAEQTESFADKLLEQQMVEMIGLGARDSLRLEAGLSLYGQDLDETTSPLEAGLIWAVPKTLRNGGAFVGAQALASQVSEGRKRMRVGLKPVEKVPVRAGALLFDGQDTPAGSITSGGFGPSVDHPVALGLIPVECRDQNLFADVRGRKVEMEPAKLPFVPHQYKK